MHVLANIRPDRKGARKLQEKYGDRLICVRYRYDPLKGRRYKTVELIIDEVDWQPRQRGGMPVRPSPTVKLRIHYSETALRQQIKAAAGIWLAPEKLWQIDRQKAEALGLLDRVVAE